MNDWLKRKKDKVEKRAADRKTMGDIDAIVKKWQETGLGSNKVVLILNILARNVIDYLKPDVENREQVHLVLIEVCLQKMHRLNTKRKGMAYNYFTTIMLGMLRQLTVTKKDMMKMKEQYREYIASQRSRNRN